MKMINDHDKYGKIEYNESFWTGKKTIIVNNLALTKIGKNQFAGGEYSVKVIGSALSGITLNINGVFVKMSEKTTVIEYILAFIPLVFILFWGNIPQLCAIFPVVGGAIGGAISGAFGTVSLMYMKTQKKIIGKLIVALITFVAAIISCFLVALIIF